VEGKISSAGVPSARFGLATSFGTGAPVANLSVSNDVSGGEALGNLRMSAIPLVWTAWRKKQERTFRQARRMAKSARSTMG
jgi:hypothetical protein